MAEYTGTLTAERNQKMVVRGDLYKRYKIVADTGDGHHAQIAGEVLIHKAYTDTFGEPTTITISNA